MDLSNLKPAEGSTHSENINRKEFKAINLDVI